MRFLLLAAAWGYGPAVHGVVGTDPGSLPATTRAADGARWPVVIVLVDGPTNEAADDAWEALRKTSGFDAAETSVVALGRGPARRDAAVIAGQRWEAELGLTDARNRQLVTDATAHLPPGASVDDVGAAVVRALDDTVTRARLTLEARNGAATQRRRAVGAAIGLGALGVATAVGLLRRREALEARAALDIDLDRWAAAVLAGRSALAELPAVAASPSPTGALTAALIGEAERSAASLARTLDAIERRLAGLRHAVRRAGPFDATVPARLRRDLAEPLGLGEGERATLDAWAAGWPARLSAARLTLQRAHDAGEATRRSAREDLPIDALDAMRRRLESAGIPDRWLADHPLAASPEAAWEALDTRRAADPAGYLVALQAAQAAEEVALDRAAVLLAEADRVAAARSGIDMPEVAGAAARFVAALQGSDRLDAIRDRADAAVAASDADIQRRATLADAAARLPRERRALGDALRRATNALRSASPPSAFADLHTRLADARAALETDPIDPVQHLAALAAATVDATRVLREATERHALRDEHRRDPAAAQGRLDRERAARVARLRRAGGDEASLADGDALRADPDADVADALRTWEDATRRAEREQTLRDAAARETRHAAERAEQAAVDRRARDAAGKPHLSPTYASLTVPGGRRAAGRSPAGTGKRLTDG